MGPSRLHRRLGLGPCPRPPESDLARVVEVFDRHRVEYLIVGGHAARVYGATRPTKDSDCLVKTEPESLARVAAALRDLNARLRVSGLSDEESTALPVQIDAILEQFDFSNWRTDAGDLDIMTSMPDRAGVHRRYMDLAGDARVLPYAGVQVRVASLNAIVASKEHANRLRIKRRSPSSTNFNSRCEERCKKRSSHLRSRLPHTTAADPTPGRPSAARWA